MPNNFVFSVGAGLCSARFLAIFLLFLVFYRCSFVRQKNEKRREFGTSRTLNRLGRAPRPHASGCFSGLHNLLQANAARVIYILNVMRLAFIAAMHTPLLHIYLRFTIFDKIKKMKAKRLVKT